MMYLKVQKAPWGPLTRPLMKALTGPLTRFRGRVRGSGHLSRRRHSFLFSNHRYQIMSNLTPLYTREIILDPSQRQFPAFSLTGLLGSVFEPTEGCKVCILIDFDDPLPHIKNFQFLNEDGFPVQKKAHEAFYQPMEHGTAADELGFAAAPDVSPQSKVSFFEYR